MNPIQKFLRIIPLSVIVSGCLEQPPLNRLEKAPVAPAPQYVTLEIKQYTPAPGRFFKDLFVSNFSVVTGRAQISLSSARDGLSDAFKDAHFIDFGFSTAVPSPDSNSDSFGDLFVYLLGISATQQSTLFCAPNMKGNKSGDAFIFDDSRNPGPSVVLGLRDCEKNYLGLDPDRFDFDGDGIPDYLELRAGLNPKNAKDSSLNPSGDGMTNIEKVKRHIPIDENSKSQPNKIFAYKYKTDVNQDGSYKFTVSNIGVLNGGQDNFIALYLVETDSSLNKYLSTAFIRLNQDLASKIIQFNYWGTDPAKATNQEVILE